MKKSFLIPILFLATFLVVLYLDAPMFSRVKSLKKEISQTEKQIQSLQTKALTLQKISEKLFAYEDSLEKVRTAIPDKFSPAPVLYYFQKLSKDTGLILKSINPVQAPSKKGNENQKENFQQTFQQQTPNVNPSLTIKENFIAITLEGTLASFEDLLKKIESSSRLIEVEKISIEKSSKKELIKFNLLTKVYSLQ